ncbi:DUF1501 domain-containing protein [Oligoflexus tunisiensis]|uniref:DUF1501 domain-containing protein n=1 Tax=Oligoflexus tunisiensis TaxID=708132 RepID=UPI00159F3138|nr:DUF1501 domain-containing protein [Oligoflexus tunisiensis]
MKITRRELLQKTLKALTWSQLPLSSLMLAENSLTADPKHRFLHIFLRGGWDSALATDPAIGSKASSAVYNSAYQGLNSFTVSAKNNLIGGWGLEPLRQALASVPTAFVNGLFTEVTAHELAQNYMYSGVLSLSRSREYASLAALMGAASGTFPAHVVLGGPIPLGDSKLTHPPLQAQSGSGLSDMLRGPYNEWVKTSTFEPVHQLIKELDALQKTQQNTQAQAAMSGWESAAGQLDQLYASGVGQKLILDPAIKSRYGVTEDWSAETLIPSAFLTLAAGLSPYVTLSIDGFDTHSNHFAQHVPLMRQVAAQLATLISDLLATEDGLQPGSSLMDNTTILINSEFVRTPGLNAGSGTDHWPSASAILLGKGVQDNTVIGRTDDNAQALGWVNGAPAPRTTETQITPEHLVATLLDHMGFTVLANQISGGRILGLLG